MSLSVTPTVMTAFGLYQEDSNEESFVEAERITHMIPLLEGMRGGKAEEAEENAAVMEVVRSLREDAQGAGEDGADDTAAAAGDSVKVCTIRWRGQTAEALRAQLQPVLLHYRLHILLVQERTRRRALEMKETNERVPLVTDYYKRTPVKWRLMGYMGSSQALLLNTDSESMFRTPASTVTSVSEAKREQQFRESFMRLEDTVMRQSAGSAVSTPARCYIDDGHRSPSARNSGYIAAFSPVPLPPPGAEQMGDDTSVSDAAEPEPETFDSTVAFVDPARRR